MLKKTAKKPSAKRDPRAYPIDQPGRCYGCGKHVRKGGNLCSPRCGQLAAMRDD